MVALFHLILTQPLFNALVLIYNYISFQDLGIAIILLTILVRFILYPLFYKGLKNQAMMQKIQPELNRIKEEHKEDKEQQAVKMMALWKEHKINPFSGFILLLVQLPILLAIYRVFLGGFTEESFTNLYSFVTAPVELNNTLFGLIDLSATSMIIVVISVVAVYFQAKLAMPKKVGNEPETKTEKMTKKMTLIMPAIIFVFLINLSSAIGLYILTTTVFSVFQQKIINSRIHNDGARTKTA